MAATPPLGRTAQTSRTPVGRAQLRVRWDRVSALGALVAVLAMVVTHAVFVAVRDDQGAVAPKPAPIQASDKPTSAPQPQLCPPARLPSSVLRRRFGTGGCSTDCGTHLRRRSRTIDACGARCPAAAQVQATFFVVGKKVTAEPEMLRRVLAEGHIVGNPPGRTRFRGRPAAGTALASEIERTRRAVVDAAGRKPCLFRPPGGIVKGAGKVSRNAGLGDLVVSGHARLGGPTDRRQELRNSDQEAGRDRTHRGASGDLAATAAAIGRRQSPRCQESSRTIAPTDTDLSLWTS